jgi:hypothetical protein
VPSTSVSSPIRVAWSIKRATARSSKSQDEQGGVGARGGVVEDCSVEEKAHEERHPLADRAATRSAASRRALVDEHRTAPLRRRTAASARVGVGPGRRPAGAA